MSDASLNLPTDSTNRLIDQPSSTIDPMEVSRLLSAVLFSRNAHSTPLEDVIKLAVKALRQGLKGACAGLPPACHHHLLLRDLTGSITGCHVTDFEEDGKVYSSVCIICTRHPKRFELVASCGLIDVCCEAIMLPSACRSIVGAAVDALSRLAEWTKPDAGTLARIATAYVHYAAVRCNRKEIMHFEQLSRLLWSVHEDVAIGALVDAATAIMTNSAWRARATTLHMLDAVINERRGLMRDGIVSERDWKSVAAAFAPLVARALGDENDGVRGHAAALTRWMLLNCKTALTPDCYSAGITGVLLHIREEPAGRRVLLTRLVAAAPKGVMDGIYHDAVRRLLETRDLGSSPEAHCAAFDVVFHAARYAGAACKASFVEEFDKFLKRNPPLMSTEQLAECNACLENKANIVAKPGCAKLDCGACACTKAHFCSSCLARVFLVSPNPYKMACSMCRRAVCIDDIRLIEEKKPDA